MGKRAFTLVELIVVIGICGLLLSFSFPTLHTFKCVIQLGASAQALASDLRKTQMQALCRNTTESWQSYKFAKTGNCLPGGSGTTVLTQGNFSKKVVVSQYGRVRVE